MKLGIAAVQTDLFSNLSAPPTLLNSNPCHDEVVELLARLLWEVARSSLEQAQREGESHDQDHR